MNGPIKNVDSITAQQLWFTGPEQLEVRSVPLAPPGPGQLRVKTLCSAISAGSEMLVYRGQLPEEMSLDASLQTLQSAATYPLQYGYACVGEVVDTGEGVDSAWVGQRVFSFQPHASHFVATAEQLTPVPDDVATESAVFLPNMETAVNLVQDGAPMLGEQVIVVGQGVVGLLLTGVLALHPLSALYTFDTLEKRQQQSLALGARASLSPLADLSELQSQSLQGKGADLIYEVSGVPDALNLAITLSGFDSRIVIGSWYGNKSAAIALGAQAHRNRLKITTSQVSTLASALSGRWDKTRRFELAWQMIRRLQPQTLISHRRALNDAGSLYQLLHEGHADVLQAVFVYD
ncbi:zinc-binding alcohol dehydrogenase [Pseudohongiella sp.]|uniref:Alcohol dehydrogenase-like C-terminal domain-containing protein n=1 Tax=marine sediment metagenome TaxID=412755 RepID=A0A0F9Z344_9ZZZZ|nr:zinc-binding alcohol dehydrogenase [Pseudohongiella sp.]HDZ09208.1 oxidoreductase [Pseudohongiella sp.]HEA63364.1 oxidoreductase [Pseudohongiella sp.]